MTDTTHTSPQPQPSDAAPGLADRLRGVVVQFRAELDISRHVFRDGPSYVVRDPITFATHRFDPADYRILSALRSDCTLGQTFDALVAHGDMTQQEEEDFYAFIVELHQRSLLTLPVNNADALYQRFERRRRAEQLARLLGVFFLRVPLVNPDRFLSRTLPLARWLFTIPALLAWAMLMLVGLGVAIARFDDLAAPAVTIFSGENFFLLWVALIGLKIVHEFGHAYAAKAFGGHVPEMGAIFILFTPVAYVDATDSWTFTSTRRRAIVTLGGVYFESIIGAAALFVWAATGNSMLNAFAYQVVILATVTTAAFNLNPLLRYDAYYLVSDMLSIPNLRARCQEALAALTKRTLFGLRTDGEGEPLPIRPGLASFGFAQLLYRSFMMVTISTVLVMKFGTLGILLAVVMLGLTLAKSCTGVVRYVLSSAETAAVRVRAAGVTFGISGGLLAALLLVPVPWPVSASGFVSFERSTAVRAPADGVIREISARAGQTVHAGEPLVILDDPIADTERFALLEEIEAAGDRFAAATMESPAAAVIASAESERLQARLAFLEHEHESRRVRATEPTRVLEHLIQHPGTRVKKGEPILAVGAGAPQAVFHLSAIEFDAVRLDEGDRLALRSPAFPDRAIEGTVVRIAASGTRVIDEAVVRAVPEGLVPLLPSGDRAIEPYFEVRIALHPRDAEIAGAHLAAKFKTTPRTTASVILRRAARFLNRVKEGADR